MNKFLISLGVLGVGVLIYLGKDASADTRFGIVGIGGVVAAAIINQRYINQREFASRHFELKLKGYQEFGDMFFELAGAQKGGQAPSMDNLQKRMIAMKKSALFSASPSMIKAWNKYETSLADANHNDSKKAINTFDDLIREIRRELGHDDSSLKRGEIMQSLILKKGEEI